MLRLSFIMMAQATRTSLRMKAFCRHAETHCWIGGSLHFRMLPQAAQAVATGTLHQSLGRASMPFDASGDVRLPHVNDLHPDVATFMIARAFAETYRDVLDAPIPDPLVAILRQMEIRESDHERSTA
jgi:hypothetical protein